MMLKDIRSGDVVISTAGKDQGKTFLVTEIKDGFLFLVDGKTRKPSAPKKKSPKHVKLVCEQALTTLADQIKNSKAKNANNDTNIAQSYQCHFVG